MALHISDYVGIVWKIWSKVGVIGCPTEQNWKLEWVLDLFPWSIAWWDEWILKKLEIRMRSDDISRGRWEWECGPWESQSKRLSLEQVAGALWIVCSISLSHPEAQCRQMPWGLKGQGQSGARGCLCLPVPRDGRCEGWVGTGACDLTPGAFGTWWSDWSSFGKCTGPFPLPWHCRRGLLAALRHAFYH